MADDRALLELPHDESMRLLASVPVGRLVFTHRALPAIRPVNHLVVGNTIVIGLTPGSAIARATAALGTVVAYEADSLNVADESGWSVIVVGVARPESDPAAARRYRLALRPWLAGATADIICVSCEIVTGFRLAGPFAETEIARAAP